VAGKAGLTCNESETAAVILAIDLVEADDIIVSDSQIALGWLCGGWSQAARELVKSKGLELRFVPRAYNLAGLYNEEHPARKPGGRDGCRG